MQQKSGLSSGMDGLLSNDDARIGGLISNRQATHFITATGNNFIDGVSSGYAWSGGKLTYAFPDSKSDYSYGPEKQTGFDNVSSKIAGAATYILDTAYGNHANDGFAVEGFTKLHISKGSDSTATIRYAESSEANDTAYGYYPSRSSVGGDVWFGHTHDYSNAVQGNYDFATVIHETGHALGLKHGHLAQSFDRIKTTLDSAHDSLEYSVMTYNSYKGDDATGYSNEKWGYPQTYMMADIAALQHMYGANYSVNDGNTRYSWKPSGGETLVNGKVGIDPGGNRIFATIWDGGGRHDSYDLSAYSNNVLVDLTPGAYSVFKNSQRADLDVSSNADARVASGNIYNALMYKGNTDSLIEDAIGGSGNDKLYGNKVGNHLEGNAGNDKFYGGAGNDIYDGGGGADIFFFKPNWDRDKIAGFQSADKIDLSAYSFASFDEALSHAANDGKDVLFAFGGGDALRIQGMHKGDLQVDDIVI